MDQDSFGLQVVHAPPLEADVLYTIVFVHGLGGSQIRSWTHADSNWFWPGNLREHEGLQDVRIAMFGYNARFANIFGPRNVLSISDCAIQLLDCLQRDYDSYGMVSPRCDSSDIQTRILFVSADIGGLVVKKVGRHFIALEVVNVKGFAAIASV